MSQTGAQVPECRGLGADEHVRDQDLQLRVDLRSVLLFVGKTFDVQ
jgi:hypothetical protein